MFDFHETLIPTRTSQTQLSAFLNEVTGTEPEPKSEKMVTPLMVTDEKQTEARLKTATNVREVVHTQKILVPYDPSGSILTILIRPSAYRDEATTDELAQKNATTETQQTAMDAIVTEVLSSLGSSVQEAPPRQKTPELLELPVTIPT